MQATEDSAFLKIAASEMEEGGERSQPRKRSLSPQMREDHDLLWELFERHYFVKSKIRQDEGLISELPKLKTDNRDQKRTLRRRRQLSQSKRAIQLPREAKKIIKEVKDRSPDEMRML